MDRRVGVLRVAQDIQGEPHALKRGVDVVFGCAFHDRAVDLLHARVQGDVVLGAGERRVVVVEFLGVRRRIVREVGVHLARDLCEHGGVGAQQQGVFHEGPQGGLARALLGVVVRRVDASLGFVGLVGRLQVGDEVGGDAARLLPLGGVLAKERFACHVSSALSVSPVVYRQ